MLSRLRQRAVFGAVLLGVATILVPKPDPREHWAVPPHIITLVVQQESGVPDPTDPIDTALRRVGLKDV